MTYEKWYEEMQIIFWHSPKSIKYNSVESNIIYKWKIFYSACDFGP